MLDLMCRDMACPKLAAPQTLMEHRFHVCADGAAASSAEKGPVAMSAEAGGTEIPIILEADAARLAKEAARAPTARQPAGSQPR